MNKTQSEIINKNFFLQDAYKCNSFIDGLNNCNTNDDIINYIDNIINNFLPNENKPKKIGVANNMFTKSSYKNNGIFNDFIDPSIEISNSTFGYNYHIYDRDYLYSFAEELKKLNLNCDTNLIPYVMHFLDFYFGYPKDSIDIREDILYNYAVLHAEEFYKEHNIPFVKDMSPAVQMQLYGDFPLSALRGTFSAKCVERASLAQNILKLCGYNSSIMYGDCESNGKREGHCWNSIYDKEGNITIIDFSNIILVYKNDALIKKYCYLYPMSREYYLSQNGVLRLPNYHYENNKAIYDKTDRIYLIGKTFDKEDKNSNKK